jgi:hypothetical protein
MTNPWQRKFITDPEAKRLLKMIKIRPWKRVFCWLSKHDWVIRNPEIYKEFCFRCGKSREQL